jgi:hypothetical protein
LENNYHKGKVSLVNGKAKLELLDDTFLNFISSDSERRQVEVQGKETQTKASKPSKRKRKSLNESVCDDGNAQINDIAAAHPDNEEIANVVAAAAVTVPSSSQATKKQRKSGLSPATNATEGIFSQFFLFVLLVVLNDYFCLQTILKTFLKSSRNF